MASVRSRRQFLREASITGAGIALLGTACSSAAEPTSLELVRLFSSDGVIVAGMEQRLPFGLVANGAPVLGEGANVSVRVLLNGEPIDEVSVPSRVVNHDHAEGDGEIPHEHADILRYFPMRTTLPDPGIYDLEVDIDGQLILLPVQAFDPADVKVVTPGQLFPSLITPTLASPEPMDSICTLFDGPCPFHEHTVADVLADGDPLAFLIATPAFCSTSYCGPVVETLIEASSSFPSVRSIHLEVYENTDDANGSLSNLRAASQLADIGLEFEPSLFLVGRDGIVADRIDNVFDRSELELALARIA